jgi:peptidoglycan-associated lipoprotein
LEVILGFDWWVLLTDSSCARSTHATTQGGNVKLQRLKWFSLILALGAVMLLSACHKKTPPPPPPPPPPPAVPTASISANPNTINQGQSTTLTWQTTDATEASISGVGAVQPNGSQQVTPAGSTTYTLTAKGPGGTQQATTRVTVNTVSAPPPPVQNNATEEELFSQNVKDIYFDYDKADIRPSEQTALQGDIDFLKQHPDIHFTVEGHCDERGSTEYNLALGDSRATAVKNALVQGGVSAQSVRTISYGKEKPACMDHTEACWQQNRRGHFVYQK